MRGMSRPVAALLGAYRHLLQCMEDCGIQREELW